MIIRTDPNPIALRSNMNSLTLTLSPSTQDGMVGYTVRIVTAGPLATASMSADTQILRALSSTLGTPDLSPAITWSSADVSLFLPTSLVTDPTTFADTLTKKLTGVRTPVTVPQQPTTVTPKPTPTWRSGSAGGAAAGAAAGDHIHLVMPDADEDDLEIDMDPDFCLCITQAGTQCSRRPAKGKSVCAQHLRKCAEKHGRKKR
jgi:hypothetical protein